MEQNILIQNTYGTHRFLRVLFVALATLVVGRASSQYVLFTENKGQWHEEVQFKGQLPNVNFYVQADGYKVNLRDAEDLKEVYAALHDGASSPNKNSRVGKLGVKSHNYEVKFLYASKPTAVIPEKPIPGVSNYFIGNDKSKWASGVQSFAAVTYKNIYPGIDVRYYSSEKNIKYDIIVNPHADISKLALSFDGADDIKIKNGELLIKTSVETIKESRPYSYTTGRNGRETVACSYSVRGNIVRFKIDNYDRTSTLVIDPSLVFSTFSGSTSDNWGYTATYDDAGNFYAGGIVFGSDNYSIGNGPWYDNTFNGGTHDIYILKLNPSGSNRIYATYIGGSGAEQPHSLVVDKSGNLIVAGRTNSDNFPNTFGTPPGGNTDITITMLNASGTALINSRRMGGSADDGINIKEKLSLSSPATIRRNYGDDARSEVIVDESGNVWLVSCSQSNNFPLTNAFQTANMGGTNRQDAVVMKFSGDLSAVLLSSYFGGGGDDAAFVLAQDPVTKNMYIGGATQSNDLPGNKSGVLYPAYQGGVADGFICMVSPSNQLIKTSYMGTSGADIVFGLKFDRKGFPYITGTTSADWPVVNATYVNTGAKQFISKLKPDLGGFVYSTVFGKNDVNPSLSPVAFLVDRCENVYVSGWGGEANVMGGRTDYVATNTFNLPITPDARPHTPDGSDLYFFVLKKDAADILYGSFFGQTGGFGEHVDGGTSRFDENGIIYQALCANCDGSNDFPTNIGVWSRQNGSDRCNLAAVKIAFNLAGVGSGIQSKINGVQANSGCAPLAVDFSDIYQMGVQYIWDYADGTKRDTTKTPAASHVFNSVGNYKVMLIAVDSSSCNISDTSYTTIVVRSDKLDLKPQITKEMPCNELKYKFSNLTTPIPGKTLSDTSFTWDFGDGVRVKAGLLPVFHSYAAPGPYTVKLILNDTAYCNNAGEKKIDINVADLVKASFGTDTVGCAPYNALFTYTGAGGATFFWQFGDGTTSTDKNPVHTYTTPGTYPVKLVVSDPNTCNQTDSAFISIRVSDKPSALFSYQPNPTTFNSPVRFTNLSGNAVRYQYRFGDGDSLHVIKRDSVVVHDYNLSGNYNACLVAYNSAGCSDTFCLPVKITIIPAVDVPSAFSPNGDGVNDMLQIRGYGVRSVMLKVWNRWGEIVFQTNTIKNAWDGRVNGVLQPMDVYTYTLEGELEDGTKFQKKGDITLIR